MTRRVFIDTDVILDVALGREPFYQKSKTVLVMADNSLINGFITSIEVANLYYILRKNGGDEKARFFLRNLVKFLSILTVSFKNVQDALDSEFSDFEDAMQNFSAVDNQCEYIVTRNIRDYAGSDLKVRTPEEFLHLFQNMNI